MKEVKTAAGLTVSDLIQGKGTVTKRDKMLIRQHHWTQADAHKLHSLTPLSHGYIVALSMTCHQGNLCQLNCQSLVAMFNSCR